MNTDPRTDPLVPAADTAPIRVIRIQDLPGGLGAVAFGTTVVVARNLPPENRRAVIRMALDALRHHCPVWLPGFAEMALHALGAARRGLGVRAG